MKLVSELFKINMFIKLYSFAKIPLLSYCHPKIVFLNSQKCVLQLPLNRRTKNHLGSMYFGAMGIGAEATVAVTAVKQISDSKKKIDYIFKDFKAQFLKRAEGGPVHFICNEGESVKNLIDKCIESKQRETQTFKSYAVVPSQNPDEVVAEFEVTLSVKYRSEKV